MIRFSAIILFSMLSISAMAQPDTVHVVFKTHLDVGFTDLAPKVIEKYMNEYIPKAIKTARSFDKNSNQKFIWTSGSWIISEYLRVSSPEKKTELESAIQDGLICWNAYPFTADNELMDSSLFQHSLDISQQLNKQFGKQTAAAKLTDVPGETIGSVHFLHENGIRLLHIGVNKASTRADTPPVFLWKDRQGGEVVVIYESTYGESIVLPGLNHILQFAFTNDNEGPQSPEQVHELYEKLGKQYPEAVIKASNLNEFAKELWKYRTKLPVITDEIGSTWIHSAGTDPHKYADFRALMRLRSKWLTEKKADPADPAFIQFSTFLLLMAEHTGGIDEKSTIDFDHYSVAELAGVINTPAYQRMVQSWNDSRAYADRAIAALRNPELVAEAKNELARLQPQQPRLDGFKPLLLNKEIRTKYFAVQYDPKSGAIQSLSDLKDKREYTGEKVPIGLFWHESFSEEEYDHWADQYLIIKEEWAFQDFCKPGVGKHGAVSARNIPKVVGSFINIQNDQTKVLLKLQFENTFPLLYGLPEEIWMEIEFPDRSKEIRYTVQWFGKKATRLPEAFWFSMGFATGNPKAWKIEKIDRLISPLEVASKGGRNLHGFNRGIFYDDGKLKMSVGSLDCAIVAPGKPSLLDFNDQIPNLSECWHFNLFNNKWGTNFPTWYSDDAKFRFNIHFDN